MGSWARRLACEADKGIAAPQKRKMIRFDSKRVGKWHVRREMKVVHTCEVRDVAH